MIRSKINAIIASVLIFLLGSVLLVNIIFYAFGYPLSSILVHQIYTFFAILISAVLASIVYGRIYKDRASNVAKYLNESLKIEIKEKDIWKVLRIVEQLPPFVINKYVSMDINVVNEFESQIKNYKSQLTNEDLFIIRKIVEIPIPELQILLDKIYLKTNLEQFKILADSRAEPLLTLNLRELKKILFNE